MRHDLRKEKTGKYNKIVAMKKKYLSLTFLLDIFLVIFILGGFAIVGYFNLHPGSLWNPFKLLTQSFLRGQLDLYNNPSILDTASYNGKMYWPFGPFPSIVLMPFVFFFGNPFNSGYLHLFFNILNFILAYKIAKKFTLPTSSAIWLATAFIFSSVYMGIIFESIAWYFSQAIAVSFLLLSLNEYLGKKRPFLISLFLSCAVATRSFIVLTAIFFILAFFFEKKNWKSLINKTILFAIPLIITLGLLGFYNFVRFGSVSETGYSFHNIFPISTAKSRDQGLFRLDNIPTNIYYYFFKGPDPVFINKDSDTYQLKFPFFIANFWGLSLIFTSPFFLLSLFHKPDNWFSKLSLAVFGVLFFLSLCYFSPGFRQYGTRLVNDYFPFLYLFVAFYYKDKKLTLGSKFLIIISMFLNFYLFYWGWALEGKI